MQTLDERIEAQDEADQEVPTEMEPIEFVEVPNASRPDWQRHFEDEEVISTATDEPIDYQVKQQDAIESGWVRGAFVLGCVGAVVTIGGIAVYAFTGGFSSSSQVAETSPATKTKPTMSATEKQLSDAKGALVFADQAKRDRQFKDSGKKPSAPVKAAVPPRPSTAPVSTGASYPTTSNVQPVRSIPVQATPPRASYLVAPPQPRQQIAYLPPVAPSANATPVQRTDPAQLWAQIANGSTTNIQGVEVNPPVAAATSTTQNVADWQQIQGVQESTGGASSSTLGVTIPKGTDVSATLDLPIVAGQNQPTTLTLNNAIRGDSTVIPAGTQLAVTVSGIDGRLELQVISFALNGLDIPVLNPGAIQVLAVNKSPLIAKPFNRGGGFGRDVLGFGLSAIGGAADSMLSGGSVTTTSNGTTTNVVQGLQRSFTNSAIGAARGGIGSVLQSMNRPGQLSSTIAGLSAGSKVRLIFTSTVQL